MENKDITNLINQTELFQCPMCSAEFVSADDVGVLCANQHRFPLEQGLSLLFASHEEHSSSADVTEKIKSFYMDNPFPDYEEFDSVASLIERSRRSVFARSLDDQLPFGIPALEVGCGTGQMTNFLSTANRTVYGVDLCPNSLHLAMQFRDRNQLSRASFYQMNLFRPIFREATFDLVYCSGVLHHTAFPRKGFESICKLVKPNRYIIIGLYNKYMRIPTNLRRKLSKFINIEKIEPVMRRLHTDKKRNTWFNDQYRNPHESSHTIAEVASWMEANGFEFVSSIPAPKLGMTHNAILNPLKPIPYKSALAAVLCQVAAILTFGREGGLFLVIGKRRKENQ